VGVWVRGCVGAWVCRDGCREDAVMQRECVCAWQRRRHYGWLPASAKWGVGDGSWVIGRHEQTQAGTHPTDEGASTAPTARAIPQQQRPSQQAWPASKIRTTTTIPSHLIRPRTTSTSNSISRRDPHPRSSSQRPLFGLGMYSCSPRPPQDETRCLISRFSVLCALCSALCNAIFSMQCKCRE
jgi:hypothetical protein